MTVSYRLGDCFGVGSLPGSWPGHLFVESHSQHHEGQRRGRWIQASVYVLEDRGCSQREPRARSSHCSHIRRVEDRLLFCSSLVRVKKKFQERERECRSKL